MLDHQPHHPHRRRRRVRVVERWPAGLLLLAESQEMLS